MIFYISRTSLDLLRSSAVGLESYSYSRSHISSYSDYDRVEINRNDDFDSALNKIMFMLDMQSIKIKDIFYDLKNELYYLASENVIEPNSIGTAESFLSGKDIKSTGLFNYVLPNSFAIPLSVRTSFHRFRGIDDMMWWIENDK